jgi:hypothetical protein
LLGSAVGNIVSSSGPTFPASEYYSSSWIWRRRIRCSANLMLLGEYGARQIWYKANMVRGEYAAWQILHQANIELAEYGAAWIWR